MKQSLKINSYFFYFCLLLIILCAQESFSQKKERDTRLVYISTKNTSEQIVIEAAHIVPSKRQYEWPKLEYTAFVHFGLYTFDQNREHLSSESPSVD